MSKNFLEINNVSFKVGGKTKVKNVSFNIENKGDIICLLGPSGVGKTTILRTIAGLEKIKSGSIKLKNKVISSSKSHVEPENRNVSLSFQENSLFPHYTVEKNINLGVEAKKLNGKKKVNPKLIHVSTDEVFGDISKGKRSNEEDRYKPSSPYSA